MHSPLHPLPTSSAEALALLREALAGAVLTPGDPRYPELPQPPSGRDDGPVAVVVAASVADVVEAVRTARAVHLPVRVRSAGPRQPAAAGALVVDVSALDRVAVDPASGTATVGAGATWADVVERTVRHGLAPVPGELSHRAAVSDALGGGMGWLARRYGLACDNVVRYELVTPDGLLVDVTTDSHPELFWALSGSGDGTLGVVTAAEFELHPTRPAYVGALTYPADAARAVADRWRSWTTNARPELTTSLVVTGDHVAVHGCWVGDPAAGRQLVDAWRSWAAPIADDWAFRQPGGLDAANPAALLLDGTAPAMTNEWAGTLRDELIDTLIGLVGGGRVSAAEVRLGGGAARTRSACAANGHSRRDQFLITLVGDTSARSALAAWVTGAAYLDRTDPAERALRVADAILPECATRLAAVKLALDPASRFVGPGH